MQPDDLDADLVLVAGLLANSLDEAMARIHSIHRSHEFKDWPWQDCGTSTLCKNVAGLFGRPDVQMVLAVARLERGEGPKDLGEVSDDAA